MLDEELKTIFQKIDDSKNEMIGFLSDIIKIPALGPEFGGDGEEEKVRLIQNILRSLAFVSSSVLTLRIIGFHQGKDLI